MIIITPTLTMGECLPLPPVKTMCHEFVTNVVSNRSQMSGTGTHVRSKHNPSFLSGQLEEGAAHLLTTYVDKQNATFSVRTGDTKN